MKRIALTIALFATLALAGTGAGAVVCVTLFEGTDYLEITSHPGIGIPGYRVLVGVWLNGDNRPTGGGSFINGLATFCAENPENVGDPICFLIQPTGGGSCLYDMYEPDNCLAGDPSCEYHAPWIAAPCSIDFGICPAP